MLLQNDVNLTIHKTWYNKTEVQPDGITHIVDTDTQYPMYILELQKIYKIDSKSEVIDQIITDLRTTIEQLQEMKLREEQEK